MVYLFKIVEGKKYIGISYLFGFSFSWKRSMAWRRIYARLSLVEYLNLIRACAWTNGTREDVFEVLHNYVQVKSFFPVDVYVAYW